MVRGRMGAVLVVTSLAVTACGSGPGSPPAAGPFAGAMSLPAEMPARTPSGQPGAHQDPSPPIPSTSPRPRFHGSIGPIDGATRGRMVSWHPGCPVAIEDLRLLSIAHWGFDGAVHDGALIVNRTVAPDVITIFRALFDARFPIRRMRLVDEYGADDDRSMAADNTSAFNCRSVTGGSRWSEHSYGWAIDINPIQNPYVTPAGTVLPPEGARYADRSVEAKGMVHPGDLVVSAFAAAGWIWGGGWTSIRDYQHFSATGR